MKLKNWHNKIIKVKTKVLLLESTKIGQIGREVSFEVGANLCLESVLVIALIITL